MIKQGNVTEFNANALVPQRRGCYDHLSEYRRTQKTSNLREFTKKGGKVWSCDKSSSHCYEPSTMLFDCPEIKPQQRIYWEYPTNWWRYITICLQLPNLLQVGEKEGDPWKIFYNKGRVSWEQGRMSGEFTITNTINKYDWLIIALRQSYKVK